MVFKVIDNEKRKKDQNKIPNCLKRKIGQKGGMGMCDIYTKKNLFFLTSGRKKFFKEFT